MKKDLDQHLLEIRLRAKKGRRAASKITAIALAFIIIASIVYLLIPLAENIRVTLAATISISTYSIVFQLLPLLIRPLNLEDRAFIEIFEAAKLSEKSSARIFLEETSKHLKKAHKLLGKLHLKYLNCYREVNTEVRKFREIIKGMMSALNKGELKSYELKEMAYTLAEPTIKNLEETNAKLWDKYHGKELKEHGLKHYISRFYATSPGRIVMSLTLGYGLIILISFGYCLLVNVDFSVFSIQNPSILIMGGAILSGISFFGKR